MKQVLKVSNIKCGGCVSSIENALKKFSDISDIKVDKDSGLVELESSSTTKERISEVLNSLGYPVVG